MIIEEIIKDGQLGEKKLINSSLFEIDNSFYFEAENKYIVLTHCLKDLILNKIKEANNEELIYFAKLVLGSQNEILIELQKNKDFLNKIDKPIEKKY